MAEKKAIKKNDWIAQFNLIGTPKISEEYTFKIDEKSEKSKWIYNNMNLGIDCGEKYGVVYCELMGGYSEENKNQIYAHGKKDDDTDDFEKQIIVAWEDRLNENVLEQIGDLCFITVGLEKTSKDKTFYKKFLSAYDAIAYIKKHLTEDMVVNIRGNLKYSSYNGNTQVRKNITSIVLSKVDDASKYKATFTQSILLDKDSASLKNIDKERGILFVDTKVLDYVKEVDGIEVKGQYPYSKQFEFEMDFTNQEVCKKIMDKLFKVKKGYTQVNFEGEFIEGGAVVTATWDDVPDDIKFLVEMNMYTKEEALAKCTAGSSRERRMVLRKPAIRLVGDDEKVPVLQIFEERYAEEDLILDYLFEKNDEKPPFNVEEEKEEVDGGDELDWLSKL